MSEPSLLKTGLASRHHFLLPHIYISAKLQICGKLSSVFFGSQKIIIKLALILGMAIRLREYAIHADHAHIREYADKNLIHIDHIKIFPKNFHFLGQICIPFFTKFWQRKITNLFTHFLLING